MDQDFQQFQNDIDNHKIDFFSKLLNQKLQKYKCFFIKKNGEIDKEIIQRKNKSNIITINYQKNDNDEYFIICFENTIIILSKSAFTQIQPFFTNNTKSLIINISNNYLNEFFKDKMEIKNINYMNMIDYFFSQQQNMQSMYRRWNKIIQCIFVYFIEQKINDTNVFNNRIKKYFQSSYLMPNNDEEIKDDKYIAFDYKKSGTASTIKLIYDVDKNDIFIYKIYSENNPEKDKLFEREHKNYLTLNHPLISKYYGHNESGIIIEYIKGKTLDKIGEMSLTSIEKIKIIFEILIVIEYLHNKHFVYRDLKPDNILIENKTVVLTDFDRLINLDDVIPEKDRTKDLNYDYGAPDLKNKVSYENDIFSIALIIQFIICGQQPTKHGAKYILKDFPNEFSYLQDICKSCLNTNPNERPKLSMLIDAIYNNDFSKISNILSKIDINQFSNDIHKNDYSEFWFCIAENDNYFSQNRLAQIFEEGKIVKQNLNLANELYSLSTKTLLKQVFVENEDLYQMYSEFNIIYVNSSDEQKLFENLNKIQFLTYYISKHNDQTDFLSNTEKPIYHTVVFCCEGKCFIYNLTDIYLIMPILSHIAANGKTISINAAPKKGYNEDIINFCNHYINDVNKNQFIQYTIYPIAAYLIRRQFQPSYKFKNTSFFNYDEKPNDRLSKNGLLKNFLSAKDHEKLKENFRELYPVIKTKQAQIISNTIEVKYHIFNETDFIILNKFTKENSIYRIVFHIKKKFVFMIKEVKQNKSKFNKENYCKISSHDSFVHFYGFLEDENEIKGLVYDYISNGQLSCNVESNMFQNGMSRINILCYLIRLFSGINYLHNLNIDDQNICLNNILLDHDFVPHIFYSFPIELNDGQRKPNQSIPRLINLFGEIIYLLFEKKQYNENQQKITRCSNNIQKLFYLLKLYRKEKVKVSINNIENYIFNEFNHSVFINYYILKENYEKLTDSEIFLEEKMEFPEIIDLSYEMIKLLLYYKRLDETWSILLDFFNIPLFLYFKKVDKPELLYQIGLGYENGFKDRGEYKKAKFFYEIAIKYNHSKSLFHYGNLYSTGKGCELNYSMANEYYEKAAKQNNLYAILFLANAYEKGLGVPSDPVKAKEYNTYACDHFGFKIAYLIGENYYYGRLFDQSYEMAAYYYEKAAEDKNPEALYKLGFMYESGIIGNPLKIDYKKVLSLYEEAGKFGNSEAYYRIGLLYYQGNNVFSSSFIQGQNYYKKAVEMNNINAAFESAMLYKLDKKDYEAHKMFRIFAKLAGNVLLNFGLFYENGYGTKKDFNEARKFYRLSKNLGCLNAYFHNGLLYYNGYGVKQNFDKAQRNFSKFSPQKTYDAKLLDRNFQDPLLHFITREEYFRLFYTNNSDILIKLGYISQKGLGIKIKVFNAIQLYDLAAIKYKNMDGYISLGCLYEKGSNEPNKQIKPDLKLAKDYFQIPAEKQNPKALYHMAKIFYWEKNYTETLKYLEKASERNYLKAYYQFGMMYLNGKGVEVNLDKAKENFEKCIILFKKLNSKNDKKKKYKYLSYNNLALIHILKDQIDIEVIEKYFRKACTNAYCYCQNNMGLIYQFYKNDLNRAKEYYNDAKEFKFALSYFNLAKISEINGNNEEKIQNYKKASEYANNPLKLFQKNVIDERLENSLKFVAYLTNFILLLHYLSLSNVRNAEIYFDRIFPQSSTNENTFRVEINIRNDSIIYCDMKSAILNYININININIIIPECQNIIIEENDIVYKNNNPKKLDKENEVMFIFKNFDPNSESENSNNTHKIIVTDPKQLFELATKNGNFKTLFLNEINQIILTMNETLYKPPYKILFGRIDIKNNEIEQSIAQNQTESFYEAFKNQ